MRSFVNLISTLAFCVGATFVSQPLQAIAFDPTSDICQTTPDATVCRDAKSGAGKNPLFGKEGIITKVIGIIAILTGVAAVLLIIVAGFRFVESGGNPEKAAAARATITYALIGLIVAGLAQAIVVFVLSKL